MQIEKKIRQGINYIQAKALSFFSLKSNSYTSGYNQVFGLEYFFGKNSKDYINTAYSYNPYVFNVIDRICTRMVEIDKNIQDANGEDISNDDFLEIYKKPNRKENIDSFLYRASATYLAAGECFIIRIEEEDNRDEYLVPINHNVCINEDTKGNIINYTVTIFGESKYYSPMDVLHIKKPDITYDTNHGFSNLRPSRKVWESNNEVWASEAALHRHKGISGVLYSDGNRPMSSQEKKELQQQYDNDYTGVKAFGKVRVSTEKLGFLSMGMNPSDLKSIETRIEHLRTICSIYNVDSKLFGDPAASTYNNMAEAKRAFIIDAVIPLAKVLLPDIIAFIWKSIDLINPAPSIELDMDSIHELQLTLEQRSVRIGRELQLGILSREQALSILYPDLEIETETE